MTSPAKCVEPSDDELRTGARPLPDWPTFAALDLVAVALLAYRLGERPASAYNWE